MNLHVELKDIHTKAVFHVKRFHMKQNNLELKYQNQHMAYHNTIGKIGEDIAAKWLISKNYTILERNYLKKCGEIDIIASKSPSIHFVEVKSVSYETKGMLDYAVSHETWRPEENVHRDKLKRLARAIETWLFERNYKGQWQIDVLTVKIVSRERFARVELIDNVILE